MILLSVLMVLSLSACGAKKDDSTIKVGILQLMTHGSLDEAREGIKDYLAEAGYDTALNNDLVEFYNKLK